MRRKKGRNEGGVEVRVGGRYVVEEGSAKQCKTSAWVRRFEVHKYSHRTTNGKKDMGKSTADGTEGTFWSVSSRHHLAAAGIT